MSTTLTIRIDKEDKEKAEKILKKLGLTLSAAINIFIKAIIRNNGIPFVLTNDAFDYASIAKMIKKQGDKK
ncbi:MAG: type II toxin-antitoxin system RelB/DinJ family antitoxin [Mycoplasmoidaceae bacterium]|nr:type II toxin-antitoxin system RelB/DinJ family antitoxin [Mycoplasmoidaceae bacterium]